MLDVVVGGATASSPDSRRQNRRRWPPAKSSLGGSSWLCFGSPISSIRPRLSGERDDAAFEERAADELRAPTPRSTGDRRARTTAPLSAEAAPAPADAAPSSPGGGQLNLLLKRTSSLVDGPRHYCMSRDRGRWVRRLRPWGRRDAAHRSQRRRVVFFLAIAYFCSVLFKNVQEGRPRISLATTGETSRSALGIVRLSSATTSRPTRVAGDDEAVFHRTFRWGRC